MSMDLEEQYDKIYRYCYFKLQRRDLAEDITQETFLRFLESKTYQNRGQALQYLYTIARNLCWDEYRRQPTQPLPEELADAGCEEQLVLGLALRAALQELPEEERELVLLRYVNEVPVKVIGEVLGLSRFAVYRRTSAVLQKLQQKLGKEEEL